jgi:hypothetical protein
METKNGTFISTGSCEVNLWEKSLKYTLSRRGRYRISKIVSVPLDSGQQKIPEMLLELEFMYNNILHTEKDIDFKII